MNDLLELTKYNCFYNLRSRVNPDMVNVQIIDNDGIINDNNKNIIKRPRYNFRKRKIFNYSDINDVLEIDETNMNNDGQTNRSNKRRRFTDNEKSNKKRQKLNNKNRLDKSTNKDVSIWKKFNTHQFANGITNETIINKKEWVSATKIKNYLLKDPIIDWLKEYYPKKLNNNMIPAAIKIAQENNIKRGLNQKKGQFEILFEMGNTFEDKVFEYLIEKYGNKVETIVENFESMGEHRFNDTISAMTRGVPIILQGALYNYSNMTFGIADMIVRSDYLNILFEDNILNKSDETFKAPNLNGDYHYRVIDIKWTTMTLCANGKLIRNSDRFPAYKGQLAIYNAAIGQIQGYTPPIAYILAKRWKYKSKNFVYEGFNCFDLLGEIDYEGFDNKYLDMSIRAMKWVREVKYNGSTWTTDYPPSVKELYPNMKNRHDAPFHRIKTEIASKNKELTEIYMVGVKNRSVANKKGIYKWSDPRCTAKNMGIFGKKVSPIVNAILKINRDKTICKILPSKILNNDYGWNEMNETDFYIDFETINGTFYQREIKIKNSKCENSVIFMIGVGYIENNLWKYKCFKMNEYSISEEGQLINDVVNFIEKRVGDYCENNNLYRNTIKPSLFHWGHAEKSMFRTANTRHNYNWNWWLKCVEFVDFCNIVKSEPIVIKGAKKFGLKEVAKAMKKHNCITSDWSSNGPSNGLTAMIESCDYYRFIDHYNSLPVIEKDQLSRELTKNKLIFNSIIKYNEMDCKTMYEIIDYLRMNHC
jgi:hypothetical protein